MWGEGFGSPDRDYIKRGPTPVVIFTMLSIALLSLLLSCVDARPSQSILRPLPKHFDAGDAKVVFIKDRMNVLPEEFGHKKDGMLI